MKESESLSCGAYGPVEGIDVSPSISQIITPLQIETTDLKESAGCNEIAGSLAWLGAREVPLRRKGSGRG